MIRTYIFACALPNGAAAKARLKKSILDAGWGRFLVILRTKAEEAGCVMIAVHPGRHQPGVQRLRGVVSQESIRALAHPRALRLFSPAGYQRRAEHSCPGREDPSGGPRLRIP